MKINKKIKDVVLPHFEKNTLKKQYEAGSFLTSNGKMELYS